MPSLRDRGTSAVGLLLHQRSSALGAWLPVVVVSGMEARACRLERAGSCACAALAGSPSPLDAPGLLPVALLIRGLIEAQHEASCATCEHLDVCHGDSASLALPRKPARSRSRTSPSTHRTASSSSQAAPTARSNCGRRGPGERAGASKAEANAGEIRVIGGLLLAPVLVLTASSGVRVVFPRSGFAR